MIIFSGRKSNIQALGSKTKHIFFYLSENTCLERGSEMYFVKSNLMVYRDLQ